MSILRVMTFLLIATAASWILGFVLNMPGFWLAALVLCSIGLGYSFGQRRMGVKVVAFLDGLQENDEKLWDQVKGLLDDLKKV